MIPLARKPGEPIPEATPQLLTYLGVSVAVCGLAGVALREDSGLFRRFIGEMNPVAAAAAASALGAALLSFLLARGRFAIRRGGTGGGVIRASGLAVLFGIVVVVADLRIVFPADLNVPFPGSLLFYPVVGFVAEILFHLLPLGLLVAVLGVALRGVAPAGIARICLGLVALLEPAYQVAVMGGSSDLPGWAVAFVGIHVLLINGAQLLVFERYGFLSMYCLRLVYYAIWHVGWGHLRLHVLF